MKRWVLIYLFLVSTLGIGQEQNAQIDRLLEKAKQVRTTHIDSAALLR